MNEKEFVTRRKPDWDRLVTLTDAAEISIGSLSGWEIREFGRLYRRVAGDLAYVRTHSANRALESFLNDLLARGHGVLYRHPRASFLQGVVSFFREAASSVRRRKVFVFAAIGVTFATAVFAGNAVRRDEQLLDAVLPAELHGALEQWKSREFGERSAEEGFGMTGFYILNNTRVALMVAAGGVTFGLASLYVLYFNGAMLGAFIVEMDKVGGLGHFISGIAAHGVSELGGVFIGGGAGLLMGYSLINPGRRTRSQALRRAGRDAMYLIGLSVVMIWVAAPIEAWVSFVGSVPVLLKLAIAGLSLVGWLVLFTYVGRDLDAVRRNESS